MEEQRSKGYGVSWTSFESKGNLLYGRVRKERILCSMDEHGRKQSINCSVEELEAKDNLLYARARKQQIIFSVDIYVLCNLLVVKCALFVF